MIKFTELSMAGHFILYACENGTKTSEVTLKVDRKSPFYRDYSKNDRFFTHKE